jgi:hypothetical protein
MGVSAVFQATKSCYQALLHVDSKFCLLQQFFELFDRALGYVTTNSASKNTKTGGACLFVHHRLVLDTLGTHAKA